ncbi:regulator of chromosome condensation 1/beta-lactamase-inhibitor protein II [Tribonema minus]|uniref:Regulator of chromosome condensation 1/beta-lactamase-inhibitor protein II n=1 Tax=Tribonema minus TaxID=303371 RepID=A0A836CDF7_9STRA|nr:regulator of chromosome condensation 1/beta-lactamase-inhibitor protein II [Tribonema minus]
MPKAAAGRGRPKGPIDPKERKMRQMSRALGIDIAQVAKLLEEQEAGGSAAAGGSATASPAAAQLKQDLMGEASEEGSAGNAAGKGEAATEQPDDLKPPEHGAPGAVVVCGGTDWDTVGKSKATGSGNLYSPHSLQFKTRIVAIYSGSTACHSIAVDASGAAYAWGRNDMGQCGVGSKKSVAAPAKMKLGAAVVAAACGRAHTALVTSDGGLYTCGCGSSGQLGSGRIVADKTPVTAPASIPLPGGAKAHAVACGADFTVVVATDGRLFAFGHPEYGQLGNDTNGEFFVSGNKIAFDFKPSPFQITEFVKRDEKHKLVETSADVRFCAVACGRNHTIALERPPGKRIFSWGFGGYGRLGHAGSDNEMTPRVINMFERMSHVTIKTLAAGGACSMALATTGHLYFWGKLPNAPRGEATMYPKIVEDLGNWSCRCMAASSQCIMVGAESSAVSWGQAIAGELGYGEGEDIPKTSRKPKILDALEGLTVTGVAMGLAHSVLLIDDTKDDDKAMIKKLPKYPA